RSIEEIAALRRETADGRNPRNAKVILAKELTGRFHGAAAADGGEADFNLRARGGIPNETEAVAPAGGPLAMGSLLNQARLAPSTSEAMRLIEGGGVRVDCSVVVYRGM